MEEDRQSTADDHRCVPDTDGAEPQDVKWVVIRSGLLDGEEFVLVFNTDHVEEAKSEEPGKVIYVPAEVEELFRYRRDAESVKKIHMFKQKFDGLIVPADSPLGQRLRWDGLW